MDTKKFKGKKVALLGLGIEGADAADFLLKKGAALTIFDEKEKEELDTFLVGGEFKLVSGFDYLKDGLKNFDFVVRSPGVYRYIPEIVEAEKDGVIITSPIKIFFENCTSEIVGVTGTKGKGTTSTLIYEILKKDGKDVYLAGNIGKPYLGLLSKLSKDSVIVLELSSFQLIDMENSPGISVVLNVTLDHMDWHKDKKEYVEAKKNIVKYQNSSDFSVINEEYESSKDFSRETRAQIVYFSKESLDEKFKENLILRGKHNLENISAAVCVARILKVDDKVIKKVAQNFKGLEHRLELVGEVDEVSYYNDSFATGPQPTMAAIDSFDEPIALILGGSKKGLDYDELGKFISSKSNVENVILIGEEAGRINEALKKAQYKGEINSMGRPTMKEVVKLASKVAFKGGVVLLSPSAASFDMFESYKDRGNQFKESVQDLK